MMQAQGKEIVDFFLRIYSKLPDTNYIYSFIVLFYIICSMASTIVLARLLYQDFKLSRKLKEVLISLILICGFFIDIYFDIMLFRLLDQAPLNIVVFNFVFVFKLVIFFLISILYFKNNSKYNYVSRFLGLILGIIVISILILTISHMYFIKILLSLLITLYSIIRFNNLRLLYRIRVEPLESYKMDFLDV